MRKVILLFLLICTVPLTAQNSSFDKFKQEQQKAFESFKEKQQAEYDAFRKRVNEEYAEFMRQPWESFPVNEAEEPEKEEELPPVVFEESQLASVSMVQEQKEENGKMKEDEDKDEKEGDEDENKDEEEEEEEELVREEIQPLPTPKSSIAIQPVEIAVKPQVVVVPEPQPTPAPIAPVKPKEDPYKKVSINYFGSIVTVGFPIEDDFKLRALDENALADAWKQLSESKYDITVSTALKAREANRLCDWAYMKMLQTITEKHYGKTNEAVMMQAFLMTQSGYRIRIGMDETKLYMLVASLYDIFGIQFYRIDGIKFYNVSGERVPEMQISKANYGKEKSISLQLTKLPQLGSDPTPKRTLTSRKGVTASASVNKNLIDFFNTYPQACFNGNQATRWAAYANTPMEKSIKDMLYPPLKNTISGMSEAEAVGILLNWVQTAFEYELDNKVWGGDRAFFAQETLYYPYCDCEDRAILFSRLVRDLVGLDVVLIYYPGHLATAVAFSDDIKGDYLSYKNRRYVVCDPTYINAGIGRTMPGLNNQEALIIALK